MSIKVVLADDHDVIITGIKAAIERTGKDIEITSRASNGREVLKIAKKSPADIYIMDISMPILNGIEATERLVKMNPDNKVIIFSIYDERYLVEKAFQCGARGYILKENTTEEVIHAIREVYRGNYFISPKISGYVVQGFLGGGQRNYNKKKENTSKITRREKEILQLIAEGYSNKEISNQLVLSLCTVRAHRSSIMRKLDIHRQADLIRYALKEGISQLEFFPAKAFKNKPDHSAN